MCKVQLGVFVSTFLILGSNHSYHLALHCFALLRTSNDEIRDHWFLPYLGNSEGTDRESGNINRVSPPSTYFITAALRISSSVFFHTPPFIIMRTMVRAEVALQHLTGAARVGDNQKGTCLPWLLRHTKYVTRLNTRSSPTLYNLNTIFLTQTRQFSG